MPKVVVQYFTPNHALYDIEQRAHEQPWSFAVFSQSDGPAYYNRQLVVDGEVVGYIICQQVLDELTIFNVAIDPKHQGLGFSHHLMQDVLNYSRKRGLSIFLEVRASNTTAMNLYRAYGFKELARRSNYYKTDNGYEDALVMKWQSGQNLEEFMPSEKHAQALQVLSYVDLTSLNNDDDKGAIESLCSKVSIANQSVAAICVFPEWVATAKDWFEQHDLQIPIATVTNFPDGSTNIERAVAETERAIAAGAEEIDVVMPYRALLNGDESTPAELIRECKDICGTEIKLKVIIESGELKTQDAIVSASEIAIANGADFIKTSTGKVETNATLSAAETMLGVIKASGTDCGFKAAGGIRTVSEAMQYIELATTILGQGWVTPERFRIGASSLLKDIQTVLNNS